MKVVKFERFVDVTGWSLTRVRDFAARNNWSGLRFHLPDDPGGRVRIERLPDGKAP